MPRGTLSWGSVEAGVRSLAAAFGGSSRWHSRLWRGSPGTGRLSSLRAAGHVWGARESEAPCWSSQEPQRSARLRTERGGSGDCSGVRGKEAGQGAGEADEATQASVLVQYFSQPEALANVTLSYAR